MTDRWTDDLVLALRLRRLRGDVIGDSLAVVTEHCRETGETPTQAFGVPEAYADELVAALPRRVIVPATPVWSTAALGGAGALGGSLLLEGFLALAAGEPAQVRWSLLLVVAAAGLGALVVGLRFDRLVERPWSLAVLLLAVLGAGVGLTALGAGFSAPAWTILAAGAVVLVVLVALLVRSRALVPDPVLAPALDRTA